MLVDEGWRVNVKRVWRIWRREGLKVPSKQPKRGRLWLNDGSCVRLRPERPNYNAVRPHSSLGYRPPAPEAILPPARGLPYAPLRSAHGLAKPAGL